MKKKYIIVIFTILALTSLLLFTKSQDKSLLNANVEALSMSEGSNQTDCMDCENSYCEIKMRLVDGTIRVIRVRNSIHFVLCR